jgi:hypothetical protein
MNLLATSCAVEILGDLGLTLLVPPAVASEVLYLEPLDADGQREQVDLTPLEEAGVLVRLLIEEHEIDLLVELARIVDDGEAEVIAIGLTRKMPIATDDRKARRVASERGTDLLSTPDILHRWESSAAISADRMGETLGLVGRRSRYKPPVGHPLYGWWMALLHNEALGP